MKTHAIDYALNFASFKKYFDNADEGEIIDGKATFKSTEGDIVSLPH